MQVKDIPDKPILEFLAKRNGNPASCYPGLMYQYENSTRNAMPEGIQGKLARAKMSNLVKRGLVSGCTRMHNCRGDYELTEKGKACLAQK